MEKKSIKETLREVVDTAKRKVSDGYEWVKNNQDDLMKLIPLGLGIVGLVKAAKPTFGERERTRKNEEWYDPRTGQRWTFRRKPTNSEWAEINRRQRCGEYTEDILRDMRLF